MKPEFHNRLLNHFAVRLHGFFPAGIVRVAIGAVSSLLILLLALIVLIPVPPLKPYSLLVEDRHGDFVHAFLAADGAWRLRTAPEEIPEKLKNILIEKEDRFFYYHLGVNPLAIIRAGWQNATSGRRISGASTITMQIARMLEPKARTYSGKFTEMFRALQLELRYSKEELLEIYLSMIPVGGNIEGLKSASLLYYQTPPERLNIAQLIDLILIPTDPNNLQPDKHAERLFAMRQSRARRWLTAGFLSADDSSIIWNTAAAAQRLRLPRHAPHFALRIRSMAQRRSEVRSSLDLRMQKTVETLLTLHVQPWKQRGVHNGAVIVVDNATKEIVAYAGSENFDDAASFGQVDAIKALSSPGSTLKPLLVALLMENGSLTPRSRLIDTPYDNDGFYAENYDGTYAGLVFADDALRRSLNVPFVRLLKQTGVPEFVRFAAYAGLPSLQAQSGRLGLSVILGGCGVTLEELAGAYGAIPAGGMYAVPSFFHQEKPARTRRVFSASTAFMITEILSGLDRPDLPNNFASATNLPKIAFKTGTSYGRRDAWTIGYSAEYTVGVWVGNVTRKGNPDLVGSRAAAPLLVDVFNSLSSRQRRPIMQRPADVGYRQICARSGHLPTSLCTHLIDDSYSMSQSGTGNCEVDKELFVSPDGRVSYCAACVGMHAHRAVPHAEYAPELVSFWESTGHSPSRAPAHNAACARMFAGEAPRIVGLTGETTYYLTSPKQRLALQAATGVDVRELVWYLNDKFYARTPAARKLFVSLKNGSHTITCLDDKGRMSSIRINVKYFL